ncbi:hypothetical protein [Modestobacter versicolor]|uniref:hypothetical protein n=1 Tax=Modestobacter versicolor TaxID=429133 RepID=UPI0034DE2F1F
MSAATSGRRQIAGRAVGTAFDQGLSSLSNAAAVFLVAGALSAGDFGWFAVGMTVALLTSNLTRPLTGVLLLLVGADLAGTDGRVAGRRAAGAALGWGAAVGAAVVLAGLLLPVSGTGRAVLLVAGFGLPVLVLQDTLRYVCFRDGRPWRAVLNDATWLLVIATALPVMRSAGIESPTAYLLVWVGGAAAGAVVAVLREGWLPDTRHGMSWSWHSRRVARDVLVEQAAAQGAAQGSVLLVGAVVGVGATGGLRGAQTLLGPLAVLQMAACAFVIPEVVRRPWLTRRQRIGTALAVALPLAVANLAYGLALTALPTGAGELLLGDAWAGTSEMVFPMSAWAAATALYIGPLCVLQAVGRADVAARISVVLAPLLLAGALVGSHLGGAPGAAWGLTAAATSVLFLWWPALVAHSGRQLVAADAGAPVVPRGPRHAAGRRGGA